jgi:3-phosphoshikimate 1-carboxyvinyltransferase
MSLVLSCPGSKSITQRALMIAALADKPSVIRGALRCDDSHYLVELLRYLGTDIRWQDDEVSLAPHALKSGGDRIFCGNAGTTVRFSSCLSLIVDGAVEIDGNAHMRKRPIGALLTALEHMGVRGQCLLEDGFPPIRLEKAGDPPETLTIDNSQSSQFATGLLLVAPRLAGPMLLELEGELVSLPYLRMTTEMMKGAGANVTWLDSRTIRVEPSRYAPEAYDVESDWSTAAFLKAAGSIAEISLDVDGLSPPGKSLQGDSAYDDFAAQILAGPEATVGLADAPDLIAPLAALSVFAPSPTLLTDVAHARIKECDRIAVLTGALTQAGIRVEEFDDGMRIHPAKEILSPNVQLDPHDDHRMAMTFGLLSLRFPGISSQSPECVSKSFPDFWQVLKQVADARESQNG